jgi:energy-coupling factor transporter ATP-binding protein EcfA2
VRLLNDPRAWWGTLRGPPLSLRDLIQGGTLDLQSASVLVWAISRGASLFVAAGPPGAGKSTLATALLEFLPPQAALYVTAGAWDRLDLPATTGPIYLLVNELSSHQPTYLWGPAAQRAFRLLGGSRRMVGTLHARDTRDALAVMCQVADVAPSELAAPFVIAVISAAWHGPRLERRLCELGFIAPGGTPSVVASLDQDAHLMLAPAGLTALATWAATDLPSLRDELAAQAAQLAASSGPRPA